MSIIIPFGKSGMPLHADLSDAEILESRVGELKAANTEDALVLAAMGQPGARLPAPASVLSNRSTKHLKHQWTQHLKWCGSAGRP